MTSRGNYFVNGRALVDNRAATLRAAINKVMPAADTVRVSITADAEASHQSVVTAMDVAGKLGFTDVSISTIAARTPASKQRGADYRKTRHGRRGPVDRAHACGRLQASAFSLPAALEDCSSSRPLRWPATPQPTPALRT